MRLAAGKRLRDEIWNQSPFPRLKGFMFLPDGKLLVSTWQDGYYIRGIIKEIYCLRPYDGCDGSFEPQRGFVVVDAGAHMGVYTLRAATKVGVEGRVIAIEPEDLNYELLSLNIRVNKLKNVIPIKLALSDFEGKSTLYLSDVTGGHSLVKGTRRQTDVSVATIDGLLSKLGVDTVDLMKMDVEGSELNVLKGSQDALRCGKILRVTAAAYHNPSDVANIGTYLGALGYDVRCETDPWGRKFVYGSRLQRH